VAHPKVLDHALTQAGHTEPPRNENARKTACLARALLKAAAPSQGNAALVTAALHGAARAHWKASLRFASNLFPPSPFLRG